MDRRHFLRSAAFATVGGMAVRGFGGPMFQALRGRSDNDRVLVVVQLFGGNDGLNTVIPLDQYDRLSEARGNVLIPEQQVLNLGGAHAATGLHPAMSGLHGLWQEGKLAIVQGVSYPEPNYSHFRATDIYETGADPDQLLNSGWTGRYLNHSFPNYPAGYPNAGMPDPLAVRIGGSIGPSLQFSGVSMGVAINNTDDPLNLTGNIYLDPAAANCSGDKLQRIRTVQRQTDLYGDVISAAAQVGCNHGPYPVGGSPGGQLAQALRIVSQLICGGLRTRIYWVSIGGFDTHAQQVESNDHTRGEHAELLRGVSDAITAFQNDIAALGFEDRVLGMTFSEFGRRIVSNGSGGTDHGSAQPMFLFGSKVRPGMVGTNPDIPADVTYQTNLAMQYDFRSVYASVLTDWFCLDPSEVEQVLLDTYQPLSLVDPSVCSTTGMGPDVSGAGTVLLEAWPNPFTERTNLKYTTAGGRVLLQMHDEQGRLVRTLVNGERPPGTWTVDADLGELAPGVYYARFQNGALQQVRNLLKVR